MKLKTFAPLVAYLAVTIGLLWAHSAWAALLGFHAGMLLILSIAKPQVPLANLFKGRHLPTLIGCILLCASSGVFIFFAEPHLVFPTLPVELASIGLTSATWPWFIAYFVLVNPWIEEYFWRGYLNNPSRRPAPVDFAFAGYHLLILYGKTNWLWIVISFLVLAAVAWLWRQVSRKTKGLLIASLSHMAADFSILLAVYWICK
jgi:membrane protease YdiL (CAAX protease family)